MTRKARTSEDRHRTRTVEHRRKDYEKFKSDPEKVFRALNRQCVRKYGMTLAERERRLIEQNQRCALCSEPVSFQGRGQKGLKGAAHVDHCHRTGKVRGILCSKCNMGLGLFVDSCEKLERAITYLKRAA